MNVTQALAVAAAGLVLSFANCGSAAEGALDRGAIRGAVNELADMLEHNYVFPDIASQYSERLHARLAEGAYDGLSDPQALADTLDADLRAVHRDAHLRVTLTEPAEGGPRVGIMPTELDFGDDRWLGDQVAYLRINGLPEDAASVARMRTILDRYADARALIIDLRTCRGGSLEVMDELFAHLFREPTRLVNMDTRPGAMPEIEEDFNSITSLRRDASAPANVVRWIHWATPTSPVSSLADAQVFLLTDRTASACEHMSLALQYTHRATLIGATTRGAGHYGGVNAFGGGRFEVFVPVGRTYVAETGQEWEGTGIAPDRAVPAQEALNEALRELGVAQSAASEAVSHVTPPPRRVQAAPGRRGYGIAMEPPRGGEAFIAIVEVLPEGPAARAGLQAGDHIVSLNGTAVSQLAPAEFAAQMRATTLSMGIDRGGQPVNVQMALEN